MVDQDHMASRDLSPSDSGVREPVGAPFAPAAAYSIIGPWQAHVGWAHGDTPLDRAKFPDWCEITGPGSMSINGHFGIVIACVIVAAPDLLEALKELAAVVRGECPSLLDEDSGGNSRLSMQIDAAIAKAVQS